MSIFDSPDWIKMTEQYNKARDEYNTECNDYWEALSYEDKLKSFYSVCKRIHEGDIVKKGTYRYVLYDTFRFDMDSYGIGMECGYMAIHNSVVDIDEFERLRKENNEMRKQLSCLIDDGK